MTILLLDFMVSLELDIHIVFIYLFICNFQEQTQHDVNDGLWECRFVIGSLYDFGNVHFNTMWNQTGRKATE